MVDSRLPGHLQPFAFLMFFQVFGAEPIAGPDPGRSAPGRRRSHPKRGQKAGRFFRIEFSLKKMPGPPANIYQISYG
jgi:hypothetical protein